MYQEAWGLPYIAGLDQHLPREQQTRRLCTGYEQGRIGAEMWVERHRERLRREVQQKRRLEAATRPRIVP